MGRLPLHLAALAATLVVSATLGGPAAAQTAPSAPSAPSAPDDPVAAADADIARLGQQADALSGQYFAAVGHLAEVQHRIDDLEARIPALAGQVAALLDRTQQRAVAAYKRSGNDLGSVIASGGPMAAVRRVQWLSRLNAHDDAVASDLRDTAARLDAQRSELRQARDSAQAALDDVKAQGRQIDALLADAQERRRVAATPPTTTAEAPTTTPASGDAAASRPTTTTTAPKSTPPATPPTAPPTYVPTPGTYAAHDDPFLVCTRTRESSGNYAAYNAAGPYMGAYQMLQSTWNSAANHAGRSDLIGVPPHTASPYDQDEVAWTLYQWQGATPWGGLCTPD